MGFALGCPGWHFASRRADRIRPPSARGLLPAPIRRKSSRQQPVKKGKLLCFGPLTVVECVDHYVSFRRQLSEEGLWLSLRFEIGNRFRKRYVASVNWWSAAASKKKCDAGSTTKSPAKSGDAHGFGLRGALVVRGRSAPEVQSTSGF